MEQSGMINHDKPLLQKQALAIPDTPKVAIATLLFRFPLVGRWAFRTKLGPLFFNIFHGCKVLYILLYFLKLQLQISLGYPCLFR